MRLFTAIDLPAEVRRNLANLLARLRPHADLRWQPPENLHITTKFIGEWPANRLGEISTALRTLVHRTPFQVWIEGLGWFPNQRAPRVFWVGVKAGPELAALARQTEDVLEPLGIAREDRPFAPHLTLARIRPPVDLAPLHQAIRALPSLDFGTFLATGFHLYLSELRPQGSLYTKLEEFSFLP